MPINLYSKDSVDDLLDAKLSISSLSNAATVTLNAGVPTAGQALTYDGTDLIWATVSGSAAWGAITGTLSTQTDLQTALDLKASLSSPQFTGTTTFTGAGGTVSLNDQALDMSASTAGGHIIVGTSGITFSDSTTQTTAGLTSPVADGLYYPLSGNPSGFITSVPNPSADFMNANAIASLIYTQSTNAYGDLSFGNVPKFITDLGTSWGIVDGSSNYYNCTGFSSGSYSLSGTAGSGPYTVRVNGTDSAITII